MGKRCGVSGSALWRVVCHRGYLVVSMGGDNEDQWLKVGEQEGGNKKKNNYSFKRHVTAMRA